MNKFEEIKQGLEEYDQAIKELHALPYAVAIDAPQQEFDRRDEIRNHFWHTKDKVDAQVEHWLRALLPVVEAAASLPVKLFGVGTAACSGCGCGWTAHAPDCKVKPFFDALAALQQSDGNS